MAVATSARAEAMHVAWGSFFNAFLGTGGYFLQIFSPVFLLSVM